MGRTDKREHAESVQAASVSLGAYFDVTVTGVVPLVVLVARTAGIGVSIALLTDVARRRGHYFLAPLEAT